MDLEALNRTPPEDWPKNAGQLILDTLVDAAAEADERILAAELGSSEVVMDDELAGALLGVVSAADAPERLRCQAALSLGPTLEFTFLMSFDEPDEVPISAAVFERIQRTLFQLFADPDTPEEVRRRILEGSVGASRDWHRDAIRTALDSGDADWQLTAVFCMRFADGFDEEILAALDSEDPQVVFDAICAAGEQGVDGAWPFIAKLATAPDTDPELRLAAIDAVVGIRPTEAEALLGELADGDDQDVVAAAREALTLAKGLIEFDDEEFPG